MLSVAALSFLAGAFPWPFPIAQSAGGSFWLPPDSSSTAPAVDWLFHFILGVSVFFFALIAVLLAVFIIRYRRRPGVGPEATASHHTGLELLWSGIPLVIVIAIFHFGFTSYIDTRTPPKNAYEIQVTGIKWKWLFTYPNGHVNDVLHVPVDTPVKLVMTSEDVIHGFFIPAFRLKQDVVPGRYTTVWFTAREPGEYQVFCTQYCGTGHSSMLTHVVVHPVGAFEPWLAQATDLFARLPPAEAGKRLFEERGCAQCHSTTGARGTGPSLGDLFASEVLLSDGSKVPADENYIRESILDPQAQVVAGYAPVMPTFKGRLSDGEITALIEFVKSLKK